MTRHSIATFVILLLGSFNPGLSQVTPLDVRPLDAVYSAPLDAIVMVSSGPNRLTVWDTQTRAVRATVPLLAAPTAVALSPDGRTAAVGHDGRITIIDVTTGAVVKVLNVSCDVLSIALTSNGWVYALPRRDQWSYIRSVNINTGVEAPQPNVFFYAGSVGQLTPDGRFLYIAQNGLSPDHIQKFDVSNGPITYLYDWTYHGTYSACGALWISPDARRIFTRCGSVFRASEARAEDMTYNGRIPITNSALKSLAVSPARDRIVTVQATDIYSPPRTPGVVESSVFVYGYQNLNPIFRVNLPQFEVLGRGFKAAGQFVFLNRDGDKWFAIVQADPASGLLNDFGVASGSIEITATHGASLSPAPIAPDQIATAFLDVDDIATATATTNPAPESLSNVSAKILGSDGVERGGRMLYAGPGQVNFIAPTDLPDGQAQLFVDILPYTRKIAEVTIRRVSPGIFSARGDGFGPPAGLALRVKATGGQTYQYLFQRGTDGSLVPNPVFLNTNPATQQEEVYLLLFGTGIRHARTVTATVGGVPAPAAFAAQPETDGLDQVNIGPLPASVLQLFGEQQVIVTADSAPSNATTVRMR